MDLHVLVILHGIGVGDFLGLALNRMWGDREIINIASKKFTDGELELAERSLQQALEIRPGYPAAHFHLAHLATHTSTSQEVAALEAARDIASGDKAIIDLEFALGKTLARLNQHEQAFPHFLKAHERLDKVQPFDLDAALARMIPAEGKVLSTSSEETPRRIFILGMPRSGTSLVEQILAAHPAVHGAGELNELNIIVQELQGDSPHARALHLKPDALSVQRLDRRAAAHLRTLSRFDRTAERVTDKMPTNFFHLGLIHQLFPGAKIIHCMRDPLDTCLSCYFQNFSRSQYFSFDLSHLGPFYKNYARLMEHWHSVITLPMIEVQYEDMIADQESGSRRIIEFCGLEWDEQCMDFHNTGRYVATASYDQVRRPIYKSSVSRWKNYEEYIGPLIDALT